MTIAALKQSCSTGAVSARLSDADVPNRVVPCDFGPVPSAPLRDGGVGRREHVMNPNDQIEPHEHRLFEQPLQRCASCGSTHLTPIVDDGAVHFLCDECARCWHCELGSVWHVSEDVRALRTLRTVRRGIRRRPRVDLTLWAMTVHLLEAMDLRLLPDEGAHDDEGGL